MEDIAGRMGVTKGVLYYYFSTKDDIYTEIRLLALTDGISRVREVIRQNHTPEARLRAAIGTVADAALGDIGKFAVAEPLNVSDAHIINEDALRRIRSLEHEYENLFEQIIQDGIERGAFFDRNAKLTTFTLFPAVWGAARWFKLGGHWSKDYVTNHIVEQVLFGVSLST